MWVVMVRHSGTHQSTAGCRKKRPEVEAFLTTDLSLHLADIL
jgi:hypothetical protein